jgi:2-oxoglutarate dehydrogenase E2 component (dihydrolipoamide succinyltransferase)
MSIEVKVPSMGESISSGILSAWLVKDGDYVEKDQPIYELETDKITSEATAEAAGVLKCLVAQDDEVEIGAVVATIDETASKPKLNPADVPTDSFEQEPEVPEQPKSTENKEESESAVKISPLAKKIAEDQGLNLSLIHGSGTGGKILKSDVEKFTEDASQDVQTDEVINPSASSQSKDSTDRSTRETRVKMSPLRKKIAQRLVQATQQAALLTTFNEVDMSKVMQTRKEYQSLFVEKHGIKLGFMSFFTKAVVAALQSVPSVNARIEGETIIKQNYYDIGVAVGTEKGLMVPTIRDCDTKSFADIEKSIAEYAQSAREGKIQLSDLEGGVFTISNGGIYGSMLSTPIINFPQPAILGLHNIQDRAVVINGEIVIRPMMYLALSYDHRLIDGKEAVSFLSTIKDSIESPDRMLFGL